MLIFWQECKHILRSKFFWSIVVLGFALAGFIVYSMGYELESYSTSHAFVEENGVSFTEKDAVAYVDYCLEHTEDGEELKNDLKQIGIESITGEEILAYHKGEETELKKKIEKFGQDAKTDDEQMYYSNIVWGIDRFEEPFKMVESRKSSVQEEGPQQEESLQYWKKSCPNGSLNC